MNSLVVTTCLATLFIVDGVRVNKLKQPRAIMAYEHARLVCGSKYHEFTPCVKSFTWYTNRYHAQVVCGPEVIDNRSGR